MAKVMLKLKPKKDYKVGEVIDVNIIALHPMETGIRRDKESGNAIPAHYIEELKLYFDGKLITSMITWETLSRDPFMQVNFKVPGKGELKAVIKDNLGEVVEESIAISPAA